MNKKNNFLAILGGAGHGKGTFLDVYQENNDTKLITVSYSTQMKKQIIDVFITNKEHKLYPDLDNLTLLNTLKDKELDHKIFKNYNMREMLQTLGTEFYRDLGHNIHIRFEAMKMLKNLQSSNQDLTFVSDDTRFNNEFDYSLLFNQVETKEDKIDFIKWYLNNSQELPNEIDMLKKLVNVFDIKKEDKSDLNILKKFVKRATEDIDPLRKKYRNKKDWSNLKIPDTGSMSVQEAYENNIINVFRPIVHPEAYNIKDENLIEEIQNYTGFDFIEIKKIQTFYENSNVEWNLKNIQKYGYARSNFMHSSERELDDRKPAAIIVEPLKKEKDQILYKTKVANLVNNNIWVDTIDMNHNNTLIIAFSAGALFDMKDAEEVFKKEGIKAYRDHLQNMEDNDQIFGPGPALGLYKSFKNLSNVVDDEILDIQFKLITKIPVDFPAFWNSYDHYILENNNYLYEFDEVSFGVDNPSLYHLSSKIDLSFMTSKETAENLHEIGIPAIYIPNISKENNLELYSKKDGGIFLISDFDGVIGDSVSEKVYQDAKKSGHSDPIKAFRDYEIENSEIPMELGPMGKVMKKLSVLIRANQDYKMENNTEKSLYPFDTTIITARDGVARKRFLNTIKAHNISVGSFHMMNGVNKNQPLSVIEDKAKDMNLLFIDDGEIHFERSKEIGNVISGYVVNDYNYNESQKAKKKKKKRNNPS